MVKKQDPSADDAALTTLSFEQALEKLEQTLAALEEGQLGLDESLAQYEQGIAYLRHCCRHLERAQRKIELLSGVDDQGQARVEPFEEGGTSLEEKQAGRGRRRSQTRRNERDRDPGMDDSGTLF